MNRERLTQKIAASKDKSRKPIEGRELDGFEYDKTKAKVLKKALHNINVSLGTLISAMKDISMIRGSEITPDGKLGGKGFIMPFKDIKQLLNESISNLSDVTDTIADELTNPLWGLSNTEKKKVKKEQQKVEDKVEEAEEIVEDPKNEIKEETKEDTDPKEEFTEEEVSSEKNIEDDKKYTEDENTEDENTEDENTEDENTEESIEKDSSNEDEEINKYRSLLASSNDKTAGTLSRRIMANLLIGENKNG